MTKDEQRAYVLANHKTQKRPQMAKALGCSLSSITLLKRELGLSDPSKTLPKHVAPEDFMAAYKRLKQGGTTQTAEAARLGISTSLLRRRIEEAEQSWVSLSQRLAMISFTEVPAMLAAYHQEQQAWEMQ